MAAKEDVEEKLFSERNGTQKKLAQTPHLLAAIGLNGICRVVYINKRKMKTANCKFLGFPCCRAVHLHREPRSGRLTDVLFIFKENVFFVQCQVGDGHLFAIEIVLYY